ncbi:MAG: hypothetical protein NC485_14465 [Ruminococcus flavefaciens]|nr:hypothetical protein [Ruminococcus flavefaciens]
MEDIKGYFDTSIIVGRYQRAVAPKTAKALMQFCEQEPEFEQAIEQSGADFQRCLDEVVRGVDDSISDLEAYNKAVKFYFSTAVVHFNMTIDLSGDNGHIEPPITMTQSKPKSSLSVSLDDLLDF